MDLLGIIGPLEHFGASGSSRVLEPGHVLNDALQPDRYAYALVFQVLKMCDRYISK